MQRRVCVVCGDEYELSQREVKALHPDFDFVCTPECLIRTASIHMKGPEPINQKWCLPHTNGSVGEVWSLRFERWFMSRYEVAVASYLSYHGIKFLYEKYEIELGTTIYLPDFYLTKSKMFLEVKGLWQGSSKLKMAQVKIMYPGLRLMVLPNILYSKFERFCKKHNMEDFR